MSKKIGLKAGCEIVLVGAPGDYVTLLKPLPDAVQFATRVTGSTDVIHVFSTHREELQNSLADYRYTVKPTAMIWVSWPKKSAKRPTEVTEDTIREMALPLGFVDVKVCAVTEIWSGLKLVIRKDLR